MTLTSGKIPTLEEFRTLLRKHDLKVTGQRLAVHEAMLELGPMWIDNFVRQTLYEMFANGLEEGFVTGTGKDMPIGMDRQVGAGVSVVEGVYPQKEKIAVNDLGTQTLGRLISLIAVDPNGKPRRVRGLLMVVNPQDYFLRVMPATTLMAPDGSFRNDVLPYPVTIVQSPAVALGEAIFGLGYRYAALAGSERDGNIEYSDHYQFYNIYEKQIGFGIWYDF